MTSRPGVPRKRQRPAIAPARIQKVIVVQNPQGVNVSQSRERSLLPVDPPKVDALVLEATMQYLKVCAHEVALGAVKVDSIFVCRACLSALAIAW